MPLSLSKRRSYENFHNGPITAPNKFLKGNLKNAYEGISEKIQIKRE